MFKEKRMRTPQSIQRTYSSSTIKRYIAAVVMLSITLPLLYIGGLTLALFITFLWMGLLYELWKTSTQNTFATWVIRFIGTTLVINTWLFAIYMVLVIPIGFRFLAFGGPFAFEKLCDCFIRKRTKVKPAAARAYRGEQPSGGGG